MKLYISIILLSSLSVIAQINKAENLFSKNNLHKAIPLFQKVAKGKSADKQKATIRLGDCYRLLNDYTKSEQYYEQALKLGKVPSEFYYNYGNVLKSNNKYSEALNQYYAFLEENEKSDLAKNAIKSCQEIKYWQSKPKEYEIKNLDEINTHRAEFSPVVYNNKLIFVTEKLNDLVDFEKSTFNNQPYLDIYSADIKGDKIQNKEIFSKKINTHFYDGPISFSNDGKTAVFTRVNYKVNKKDKDFVNRAKIYFSTIKGHSFSKPVPFIYNSEAYSCAHPSLNADGTVLYFVSDMPGGFGGQDIWMCQKNGDSWGKPVNLGFDINTSGDEMFPSMRKDGMLFYASNGLPGFGGLDIFSAKQKDGKWLLNRNESMHLNSSADDFGVIFTTDSSGYFSSNRVGGKGSDDIYSFKYTNKYIVVDGTVLLTEDSNNPAKQVKVFLLDSLGKRIDSTLTDDKGYFVFRDLDADKVYMAEVESDDIALKNKARYYLADKNKNIVRMTHKDEKNQRMYFRNLPTQANSLPDLYDEDDLSLAGNLLYGESPSKPIANKKIVIKNAYGDVVETTTTNEFGAFAFRNLPINQDYSIYVEESDLPADIKVILTNKKGKEVKVVKSDGKGKFKFSILGVDKSAFDDLSVDDKDLIMAMVGYLYDQDKKAIPNAKVVIFNKNEVIENIITDEQGKFQFKNLGADKNYLFTIEDSENRFQSITKIYIADSKGRIYREILRNTEGKFQFNLLEVDKAALGDYSVNDPWLEVLTLKTKQMKETITIIENLYYAFGDYKIDAAGRNIMDKVFMVLNSDPKLKIEISSHTDSRSSDAFNLTLSQKRAKEVVNYLIAKGIQKDRLRAIGYGETKLLNQCKNGVECAEEEHALNRRTEFKIVEKFN